MTKENILQNRVMRMKQLTEYCALSRAYIYQKITEGEVPKGEYDLARYSSLGEV